MSSRNIVLAQEPEIPTQPGEAAQLPPAEPVGDPGLSPHTGPSPHTDGAGGGDPDLKALGREALESAEVSATSAAEPPDVTELPAPPPEPDPAADPDEDRSQFDLARVAWLVTVLSLLLAVTILALDGYAGYAAVTFAVALAAAINLA